MFVCSLFDRFINLIFSLLLYFFEILLKLSKISRSNPSLIIIHANKNHSTHISKRSRSKAFKIISKFSIIICLYCSNLSGASSSVSVSMSDSSKSESIAFIKVFCFLTFLAFAFGFGLDCLFFLSFFLIRFGSSSGSDS